jgi:membrane-bound serine protease (ClpP class)
VKHLLPFLSFCIALFVSELQALELSSNVSLQSGNVVVAAGNTIEEERLPQAVIIPVEGMVKKLLFTTMKRRTEKAIADGCTLIVYRVKSDGGELGAAFEMSNYVFSLDKKVRTIAYVEDKAYSAAALFSLSCDDVYMKPLSAIGDCEPIMMTDGGYTTAGEKVQTVLKERFRTYSRENGYPVVLAQSMVSSELKILSVTEKSSGNISLIRSEDWDILGKEGQKEYKDIKIVCHEGDLLTLSSSEALALGFSRGTFDTPEKMLKALHYIEHADISDVNKAEKVIDVMEGLGPLFIIIAVFFLYLELKTPGIGVFGALSAVAFAAFFVGKYYEGQAGYMEATLFILAIVLIAMEIFVFPGFGVAGIAGVILMFISLVLAMQDFTIPRSDVEYNIVLGNMSELVLSIMAASGIFILMLFVLPRSKFTVLPGLISNDTQDNHQLNVKKETLHLDGKFGIAATEFMPGGKVEIDGELYQANSITGWIEKGSKVIVVKQEGNLLLIKPSDIAQS